MPKNCCGLFSCPAYLRGNGALSTMTEKRGGVKYDCMGAVCSVPTIQFPLPAHEDLRENGAMIEWVGEICVGVCSVSRI